MSLNDDSRLNLLELKCRRPVEHVLAGEYRSVFKGRGIEFEDVRPYFPGDDVRAMDWKVTARTRVPHVKRYVEEREQFFFLLVDLSASTLSDRNGAKRKTVSEFCALLTLAALSNNDRVGLILFTDQVELVVPPAKGRQQSMRILDVLNSYEPKGTGTRIDVALDALGHMARKRSVAFVVSDYYTSDYGIDLQAAGFRHDVIAVNLIEPFELETPDVGLARLRDAESGEERVVDFGTGVGKPNPKNSRIREQMLDCGVDLIDLKVGDDCVLVLATFFKSRQRMLAGESGG
ncbi:DUF58 domain-containing protein [Candidatus Pelagisphaera phototrophica]|uniref:DUF58 domain-containing protein n=1 Tax=Candidatus Pelagisphaera phototrophica TaxID=2684113 RepID=UPI0019E9441A|nr:DUF58 domain-containing protein [Candidatus Pelagisphaera phototrophica]QXD33549.1 DUF58 domain-containing protein [Candidatus Pelagisphaera phototrophica]